MNIDEASYEVIRPSDLFRLLCTLDIPRRTSGDLVATFYKWLHGSGPEWTIDRLKNLHLLALQWASGNVDFRLSKDCYIKCHADGTPIGPFSWFFRNLRGLDEDNRKLDTIFTALKMYSAVTLRHFTDKQFKKFYEAVECPNPDNSNWDWKCLSKRWREGLRELWAESSYDRLERWINTPKKKVLHYEPGTGYLGTVSEIGLSIDQHRWDLELLSSSTVKSFRRLYDRALGEHCLPADSESLAKRVANDMLFGTSRDVKFKYQFCQLNNFVGKIGVIQERGGKARTVANPLRGHQVALSRLHSFLELVVKRGLPWDCSFDQEKGVRWIQRKLSDGHTLVATDLSSFSDQFPLEVVTKLLETIGPMNDWEYREAVKLLVHISRSNWYFPTSFGKKLSIKWAKGCPLGTKPGFLADAVTHGMILHVIQTEQELEDAFVVLGDDVIMLKAISSDYKHTMKAMGVPINEMKTLESDRIGEFASRLASQNRIISSMKFPQHAKGLFKSSKPLELLEKYGMRAIALIPKRFRMGVTVLASLPKSYGGLGKKLPKQVSEYDAFGIKEIIKPNSDDPIPDVLKWEAIRGGRSIIVYKHRLSDRLMDLEVAFGPLVYTSTEYRTCIMLNKNNNIKQQPIRKQRVKLWQVQETCASVLARLENSRVEPKARVEEGRPSEDLQWEILHSNSSLDDLSPSGQKRRDCVREDAAEYPDISPREFVLKDNDHIKLTSTLTGMERKLQSFIDTLGLRVVYSALKRVTRIILRKGSP